MVSYTALIFQKRSSFTGLTSSLLVESFSVAAKLPVISMSKVLYFKMVQVHTRGINNLSGINHLSTRIKNRQKSCRSRVNVTSTYRE